MQFSFLSQTPKSAYTKAVHFNGRQRGCTMRNAVIQQVQFGRDFTLWTENTDSHPLLLHRCPLQWPRPLSRTCSTSQLSICFYISLPHFNFHSCKKEKSQLWSPLTFPCTNLTRCWAKQQWALVQNLPRATLSVIPPHVFLLCSHLISPSAFSFLAISAPVYATHLLFLTLPSS